MAAPDSAVAKPAWRILRFVRTIIASVVIVLAVMIFTPIAVYVAIDVAKPGFIGSPLEFESDEWKQNETIPCFRPIRFRMHRDLIWSRVCVGKTTAEVEALLGAPDGHPRFVHPQYSEEKLVYFLRHADSDGCSLCVYAENGVVTQVTTRGSCNW